MPELTADDLLEFTDGRLDDGEDVLAAAQSAARLYCGWHVCPVVTAVVVQVDDVAANLLALPTLRLVELVSVTELGDPVDLAGLHWAIPTDLKPRRAVVSKARGCWPATYGAVTVTMTHGFTEAEAADWRRAVLRLADMMDRESSSSRDPGMVRKKVDDVEYQWAEALISTDERLSALFAPYRILPSP